MTMNPNCPAGNTKAFQWPSCCHLAYWLAEGKTYLSAGAAFRFMEFDSCHLYSYKELEHHLLRCGVKNAFVKGTSGQSIFISLEAFLHFLFGGFGTFFDNNIPIDNVVELRNFVMSTISKGQQFLPCHPVETRDLPPEDWDSDNAVIQLPDSANLMAVSVDLSPVHANVPASSAMYSSEDPGQTVCQRSVLTIKTEPEDWSSSRKSESTSSGTHSLTIADQLPSTTQIVEPHQSAMYGGSVGTREAQRNIECIDVQTGWQVVEADASDRGHMSKEVADPSENKRKRDAESDIMVTLTGEKYPRFGNISPNQKDALLVKGVAYSTKCSTQFAVNVFEAWRREKGVQDRVDTMDPEVLADTLENFYVEARNARGELYSNNTMLSIRHSLERYLTDAPHNKPFSIIHDRQFKRANDVLKAHLEQLSNDGVVSSLAKRRIPIAEADIRRLFLRQQLGLNTPDALVQTAFFYFIIFSGKCAREYISFVNADDFRFEKTSNGHDEYLIFNRSCRANDTSGPGCFRVSSWPGNPCCPVACFKKYLSKRNAGCPGFWQNPKDFREFERDDPVWFRPAAIGKNRLKGLVTEMSKKARLSTLYTCQNIIFTSLEAVKAAAIEYGTVQGSRTYAMARQGESRVMLPLAGSSQLVLRPILPSKGDTGESPSFENANSSSCSESEQLVLLHSPVPDYQGSRINEPPSFTATSSDI